MLPIAVLGLLALVVVLAVGIVRTQEQSRSQIQDNFRLRGTTSARFVSTFFSQQADRQREAARQFFSGPRVPAQRFSDVVAAFGSGAAVLLDARGRLLDVVPANPPMRGTPMAKRYAHLAAAQRGAVAISDVVPSAVTGDPVVAVAVPFSTSVGRRVFSAAYGLSGSTLGAFVDHTISHRQHEVYLVDGAGSIVAASPRTTGDRLREVNPTLWHAVRGSADVGAVEGAEVPTTFTAAKVPGTSWTFVIAVPDSRLYASVSGRARIVPWLIFALVSALGTLLVLLVARVTTLSHTMEQNARTDSLTGLYNRRALAQHLTHAAARARRHGTPMSVLMIDLDHFKAINDRFGHAVGDRVLRAVAECMRHSVRAEDVFGRWGGDEFLILLPDGDEHAASVVAERVQAAARGVDLSDIGLANGIRLSVGTATAASTTPDDIVHAADLALYQAKAERPVADPAVLQTS